MGRMSSGVDSTGAVVRPLMIGEAALNDDKRTKEKETACQCERSLVTAVEVEEWRWRFWSSE